MKFLSYIADNLFSIGHVELDLSDVGLVLVTGYSKDEGSSNGSGKSSSTTKGITWTAYGQTPHGLKADKVVNRHSGKKKAYGELNILDDLGRHCRIYRQRSPNKLVLEIDGNDVSARKASDTQAMIDNVLGRNFQTFIQTDFFGQGRQVGYAALTSGDQKKILEKILPIEKCNEWSDYADKCLAKVKENHAVVLAEANTVIGTYEELNRQVNSTQKSLASWEDSNKREIQKLEASLVLEQKRFKTQREDYEKLQALYEAFVLPSEEELKASNDAALSSKETLDKTQQSLRDADSSYKVWTKELQRLDSLIDKFKVTERKCPTCDQIIEDNQRRMELEQEFEQLKVKIEKAKTSLNSAENALVYYKDEVNKATEVYDKYKEEDDKNKLIVTEVNSTLRQLESARKLLDADNSKKFNSELEVLRSSTNPFIDELSKLKQRQAEIKIEYDTKLNREKYFLEEMSQLDFWKKFFSKDIKIKLFEAACPFLDEAVKKHLVSLNNAQINVHFSTIKVLASGEVKEDFQVNVSSDTGGEDIASLSGGEQQMVDLAIGLALSDLANTQTAGRSNLLILDEPFSQLDDRNCESIVNYLTNVSNKASIFLVSNEENLKMLIPNRIHIVKENGVSNLE